ncbi:Uncharacterised protein [Mycobacteroides abscessus subsp. abscessus]|nr:Uncharacterised protein [Mycobacteroides abscessus subsp. abscessus]
MILHFNDLNKTAVRACTREDKAFLLHCLAVMVVELIAMAVALINNLILVSSICICFFIQLACLQAKAERPSEIFNVLLLRQQVNDRMRCRRINFR